MTYTPEYKSGEIIVMFKEDVTLDFSKHFGIILGYECKGTYDFLSSNRAYIFKVEEGKEDTAMQEFQKHNKFIESVDRRDVKYERRRNGLDELCANLTDIEVCEISDEEFKDTIDKMLETYRQQYLS